MRSQAARIIKTSLRHRALVQPATLLRPHSTSARNTRPTVGSKVLRAAPTIPFFGAFFSSNKPDDSKENMSYPDQRSEAEWRAVLNPGACLAPQHQAIREAIHANVA